MLAGADYTYQTQIIAESFWSRCGKGTLAAKLPLDLLMGWEFNHIDQRSGVQARETEIQFV